MSIAAFPDFTAVGDFPSSVGALGKGFSGVRALLSVLVSRRYHLKSISPQSVYTAVACAHISRKRGSER